ncbi:MAG: mucoidy inhibitor MuiA family protein [Ottowia sp.]
MPMRLLRFPALAALASLAASLPAAAAAPESAASRITRVTVYPGAAVVERAAPVAAGARRVVFECLPAKLDEQSLTASASAAVRVGEISVQTLPREQAAACASPLQERIRELQDKIAAADAEKEALDLSAEYLKAVIKAVQAAPDGGERATATNASTITATAEALRKSGQDNALRALQLDRRKEDLQRQLKPLLAESRRLGGSRVTTVTVTLAAEKAGEARLSYQVRGPGWQPGYRAALDPAGPGVKLERLALVAQDTGEDWQDVALTLSTGQPGRATQAELPRPWTLDISQPELERARSADRAYAPAMAPAVMSQEASAEEAGSAPEMPRFEVETTDRAYATEFRAPQRITVPASGERVTLTLGSVTVPARLITRAAPAVEEAAYLMAEITPPDGIWPAGPMQLTRDGALVGSGRLDFSQPAPIALSFGPDEQVSVKAEAAQDMSGSAGFMGSKGERKTRRAFSVQNRRKTPIELQVIDAAPISKNERITVQSAYTPKPADTAFLKQPGLILWQQSLAAGATASFSAEHTIQWPKDAQIDEWQ